MGDNTYCNVIEKGSITVQLPNGNIRCINEVLHVPDLRTNLISVEKVTDSGYDITFKTNDCIIRDMSLNQVICTGQRQKNLYKLNIVCKSHQHAMTVRTNFDIDNSSNQTKYDINVWHYRMGHIGEQHLKFMSKNQMVEGLELTPQQKLIFCSSCLHGKQQRLKFPVGQNRKSSEILELVHSDVCGPMQTLSHGKMKYFVTFIDDFSRKTTIYFIFEKSQVLDKFKIYKALVENQSQKKIRKVRSDNGGEYV